LGLETVANYLTRRKEADKISKENISIRYTTFIMGLATIGLSGVRALPLGVAAERSATYFSPRRGFARVLKFCTEF
jgi:hypothetical protein